MHATGNSVEVFGSGGWQSEVEQMLLYSFRNTKGAHLFNIEDVDCIVVQRRLTKQKLQFECLCWNLVDQRFVHGYASKLNSQTFIGCSSSSIPKNTEYFPLKMIWRWSYWFAGVDSGMKTDWMVLSEVFHVAKWWIFGDLPVSDVLVLPLLATWSRPEWQVCCRRRSANTWRSCCGGSFVLRVCWIALGHFAVCFHFRVLCTVTDRRCAEDAFHLWSWYKPLSVRSSARGRSGGGASRGQRHSYTTSGHRYFSVWF